MTKRKIYNNILFRKSNMDCSPGIHIKASLVNTEEVKSLTNINQPENLTRGNKYGAGVAPSRTYTLPQGIDLWGFLIRRPKHLPWG